MSQLAPAQGELSIVQAVHNVVDIAQIADAVGVEIAEHRPWEVLALRDILMELPLIGNEVS